MDWNEAQDRIRTKIQVGTDVNIAKSKDRVVKSVDSVINSKRCGYHNERGFVVPIGKTSISIPWSMLEECFCQLSGSGFSKASFEKAFPCLCNRHGKLHKPCYIHVIGQMFVKADVARETKNLSVNKANLPECDYRSSKVQ